MDRNVVVVQYRLLHYRAALFERLRRACASRGIGLTVLAGQPSERERTRADEGRLPWVREVTNRFWTWGDRDFVWQPMPADLRSADLVVVMQESRLLSNYPLLLRRALGGRQQVAYWGHGRNFQADAPAGLRERWKRAMVNRVDWWFAYTELSREVVRSAGFPDERITVLNNAIDNEGFVADLKAVDEQQVHALRQRLGATADSPVGVYCGSLYADKRLDLLAEACEQVVRRRPDFRLVVMGDGPARAALLERCAGLPWFHWVGVQRGRDKAAWFKASDLYLSPGAVGLHVLDSFVAGTPMITTADALHGPEIAYLRNGVNGLVTAGTSAAFGDAVLDLLEDPPRRARLRDAALRDGSRYTLDDMVERFLQGLLGCLSQPRRAG